MMGLAGCRMYPPCYTTSNGRRYYSAFASAHNVMSELGPTDVGAGSDGRSGTEPSGSQRGDGSLRTGEDSHTDTPARTSIRIAVADLNVLASHLDTLIRGGSAQVAAKSAWREQQAAEFQETTEQMAQIAGLHEGVR